jgi:hypothetical protein
MDNTAFFNRSVWDVTGLAHDEWRTVGDNAHGRRVSVPLAGSIKGQMWFGSQLAPRDFRLRGDFKTYATRWEQRYCVLIPDRTASLDFVPVVSDKSRVSYNLPSISGGTQYVYPVIAHHGTASVTEIIVPRKFATSTSLDERRNALESLLDQDVKAYVERGYPPYGDWGPFADSNNLGPNNFTVLTDPDGRILVILDAFGNEPGLESEDPLSYLMVAPALLDLLKVGGRMVLRMASARAARKAALLAAARAVAGSILKKEGKLGTEEMIAHLTGIVGQHPELRRLMAARVLTGERLIKATHEALGEWARTGGRNVVWKTEAEMVAVTEAKNLMTLQGNELWINKEANALKEATRFYQEVVHELAADSLGFRGSGFSKFVMELQNGTTFTDLTLLENAVLRGDIEQVVRFFAGG